MSQWDSQYEIGQAMQFQQGLDNAFHSIKQEIIHIFSLEIGLIILLAFVLLLVTGACKRL